VSAYKVACLALELLKAGAHRTGLDEVRILVFRPVPMMIEKLLVKLTTRS